ncbi:hypothetical protein FGB62_336g016 [Gracilaria domingensis]|nr:hypothetical protein FGB62_336g016 [Gracilaria domingensis]
MSMSISLDETGFQFEEERAPPFISSDEESSGPSLIDLMDSDDQPQEVEVRREIRNQSNVMSAGRRQRQTRIQSDQLPLTGVRRETQLQSLALPSTRVRRGTRNRSNALSSSGMLPDTGSRSNSLALSARKKSNDPDESEALPPAIAAMISEMSKTMKQIQILTQRRNAERASNAVAETANSTACECPVCLEALYVSSSCATLCGHVFHAACIHQLAQYKMGNSAPCPVCRTTVHVGELLVLRSGLPEAPAPEQSSSIDLTAQTPAEEKSELDHELSRTLKAFESLYAEKNVFDHCVAVLRRNAERDVKKMKNDMEKSRSRYRARARMIDEEHERIQITISRLSQREEKLEASQRKYSKDLMEITKKNSDLKVLEERLKVKIREAEEKKGEFDTLLETVNDKQQRLDRLRQALDAKRKANDRKRSASVFVEDSGDIKKHRTQSSVVDTRHSRESPFSGKLCLPSAVNRPPPPPRPGRKKSSQPAFSLSAFVPKRSGIHRPSARVGKRNESTRS